uniref:Uncharacterized protein n=1 Tax=Romanomermis culicivorax TaxID=13658 RepID=A0A915J9L2_ROMCU
MIPIFLLLFVRFDQILGQSISKITRVVNYADAADLSCSYDHYVTEIKVSVTTGQAEVTTIECQQTSFSDVNADYVQLGCGADYFVTGLKFGYWPDYRNDNSIALKLECCRSDRIKFVRCGVGVSSRPRMPFEKWLSRNDSAHLDKNRPQDRISNNKMDLFLPTLYNYL